MFWEGFDKVFSILLGFKPFENHLWRVSTFVEPFIEVFNILRMFYEAFLPFIKVFNILIRFYEAF